MLQFIYNHAPIAFQNLMISIKGKQLIKQRYTSYYYDELKDYVIVKIHLNYNNKE